MMRQQLPSNRALARMKRAWRILFCRHIDLGYQDFIYNEKLNTLKIISKCSRCEAREVVQLNDFRVIYRNNIKPLMEEKSNA